MVTVKVVPIIAYASVCAKRDLTGLLEASQVAGGTDAYLSLWYNGGEKYRVIDMISQLAWGLGYCGMPHILTRFMAVKSQKELNKSKSIAIIWVALSLALACIIGIVGRAYLYPTILGEGGSSTEDVFIVMITKIFTSEYSLPFIGGIYSLLVGFFLSLVVIIIVSLCTKAPGEEILQEFADVADKNKLY